MGRPFFDLGAWAPAVQMHGAASSSPLASALATRHNALLCDAVFTCCFSHAARSADGRCPLHSSGLHRNRAAIACYAVLACDADAEIGRLLRIRAIFNIDNSWSWSVSMRHAPLRAEAHVARALDAVGLPPWYSETLAFVTVQTPLLGHFLATIILHDPSAARRREWQQDDDGVGDGVVRRLEFEDE